MSRTNDLAAFIRAVVVFPLILALGLGILSRQIGHVDHSGIIIWVLYLGIAMGVWFPFILRPYLKRTAARK